MVSLSIHKIGWTDTVAAMLAPSLVHEPGITVATLERLTENDNAQLFGVFHDADLVAAYILRIEQLERGMEGVIVAAGGRLPGYSLIRSILPTIEKQLEKCDWIRIHTARNGMVRELSHAGYRQREVVMAKDNQ